MASLEVRIPGAPGNDDRGGMRTVMGVDLGGGNAALAVVTATATKTTPAASAAAVQLLAGNNNRLGAKIVNNGSTRLHVQLPSGEKIAATGAGIDVDDGYLGAIDGWWEGAPTGTALVTEVAV